MALLPRYGTFFDDLDKYGGNSGPAANVRESDTALTLELEVPRYLPEDIKVEFRTDNVLIITGNRPDFRPHHDHTFNQFLYGEASSTKFRKAFQVPPWFDGSKATHALNYGVLSIVIPRSVTPPPPLPVALPIKVKHESVVAAHETASAIRDRNGLTVSTTSTPAEYHTVADMKWPPTIRFDDSNDTLIYTAIMPATVAADHIDLQFNRDGLRLGVHNARTLTKKDDLGNVVFSEEQSVQYSTTLRVPEGTVASDVSTSYDYGTLVVKVHKHPDPKQQVPVN